MPNKSLIGGYTGSAGSRFEPTQRGSLNGPESDNSLQIEWDKFQGMTPGQMYEYGRMQRPGLANENVQNQYLVPGMIMNQYNRDFTPLRQRMINPIRRSAASGVNDFFRGYGGMQGGPALSAYAMQQAPYLNQIDAAEAQVQGMEYQNQDNMLASLTDQFRYQQDLRERGYQAARDRDQKNQLATQQFWGDIAGSVAKGAGAVIGAL